MKDKCSCGVNLAASSSRTPASQLHLLPFPNPSCSPRCRRLIRSACRIPVVHFPGVVVLVLACTRQEEHGPPLLLTALASPRRRSSGAAAPVLLPHRHSAYTLPVAPVLLPRPLQAAGTHLSRHRRRSRFSSLTHERLNGRRAAAAVADEDIYFHPSFSSRIPSPRGVARPCRILRAGAD